MGEGRDSLKMLMLQAQRLNRRKVGRVEVGGDELGVLAQATGRAGKEFPAEFKGGLDAYFNLLEGQGKPQ